MTPTLFSYLPLIVLCIIIAIFYFGLFPYLVARAAREKGRSFAGFFILSICFSSIIGGLVLALMGQNKEKIAEDNLKYGVTKICPYCANEINYNAKICMYCHKELVQPEEISRTLHVKNNFTNPYIVVSSTVIKEAPDLNAAEIIEINENEIVDFLSDAYNDTSIYSVWYKIKYKKFEGWCLRECLKKYE